MRLILLVLMAGTVLAQDVTKVVEIHYSDRSRLENLIPLSKSVVTRFDPAGKFVVFQGDAKIVESLEEVLKKIDVPPLNIEFTLELISGSKNPGKASDIPAGLNGVAKEMKNLFGFQALTLIDTVTMRTQEGKDTFANGPFPSPNTEPNAPKGNYSIEVKQSAANGTKGSRLVRIGSLRFNGKIPILTGSGGTQYQFNEMGISTGLDVKEGQRVVVGKVGMDSSSNPFFLVVSCKVVE